MKVALDKAYRRSYLPWMRFSAPSNKMPRYTTGYKSLLPDYNNDAKKQFESMLEYLKSIHEN
jgi:hypothetical protein